MHLPWVNPRQPRPAWIARREAMYDALTNHQKRAIRYYAKLYEATPPWETRQRISSIYERADRLRKAGFDVEVDHIVPLNHPLASGLHVLENLQILSRSRNQVKSNKHFPSMPFEQKCLFEEDQLELNF